jgi:lysozyme
MSEPKYKNLRELLKFEEGFRAHPYKCTEGRVTLGYGRNLEARGVSEFEAALMLSEDMAHFRKEATAAFAWFNLIDVVRQDVITAMCFQLGTKGVAQFKNMIAAVRVHDYEKAAKEMLNSAWYRQTPGRAKRMAEMMRTGKYPA